MAMSLQLDSKFVLDAALDVSGDASVDALVPLDLMIECVEAEKVCAVGFLPCGPDPQRRGEVGELGLEVHELEVVADDLGVEASDPLLEFTPLSSVGSAAEWAEVV